MSSGIQANRNIINNYSNSGMQQWVRIVNKKKQNWNQWLTKTMESVEQRPEHTTLIKLCGSEMKK